jgi:uncharacterized membrane protein YebE (DUF533 family)
MFDPQKLLDQFMGGGARDGQNAPQKSGSGFSPDMLKGLAGGAAAGGLVSILLGSKGGKKLAGGALKIGGAAVLGGLAYRAWQNYQATKGAQTTVPVEPATEPMKDVTPKVEGTVFLPSNAVERNELSLILLRAMIAAAKADGHIDAAERANIMEKVHAVDLGAEAEAFLEKELANPVDIDDLVAAARTEEQKVELYTASRLTIDPDSRAERGYLDLLAGRLGLPDELLAHIDATVSAAKVQA